MEIEIWLDCDDVPPENQALVQQRFHEWYDEGSEVKPNKKCFTSMRIPDQPNRFLIDLGYADPTTSIRNLHARLHRLGVKVFIHYLN